MATSPNPCGQGPLLRKVLPRGLRVLGRCASCGPGPLATGLLGSPVRCCGWRSVFWSSTAAQVSPRRRCEYLLFAKAVSWPLRSSAIMHLVLSKQFTASVEAFHRDGCALPRQQGHEEGQPDRGVFRDGL